MQIFTMQDVITLQGSNLHVLADAIASLRLKAIREFNRKAHDAPSEDEPLIYLISVQSADMTGFDPADMESSDSDPAGAADIESEEEAS
jgi:hypothetical protein